uniref:Uncharacterized protein n=1 Tax=Photinus pyralis TaxID=7054 RepID=A0A1Y1JY17_PHOPY
MAKYPETEFSRKLTTNPNNCLCHTNQSPKPVLPDEDCRLFMTIGIFGNPFLALIDTGAARSSSRPSDNGPISRWYGGKHEGKMSSSQPDRGESHGAGISTPSWTDIRHNNRNGFLDTEGRPVKFQTENDEAL